MGGKQKRAAKYKKWMEAQNLLKRSSSQGNVASDGRQHDGSGDQLPDYQPIPYHVQQEMLKHRAKKTKKHRNTNWLLRKLENVTKPFDQVPSWPCTVLFSMILSIFAFLLLRSLIQMFVPSDAHGVDRSPLYNGLRMTMPRPLFKFIKIIDYLFTSPVLSLDGIQRILYSSEDYNYNHHH